MPDWGRGRGCHCWGSIGSFWTINQLIPHSIIGSFVLYAPSPPHPPLTVARVRRDVGLIISKGHRASFSFLFTRLFHLDHLTETFPKVGSSYALQTYQREIFQDLERIAPIQELPHSPLLLILAILTHHPHTPPNPHTHTGAQTD